MPDTKITLFAKNPIKVDGKRIHKETFTVDSQESANALIACGAASNPEAEMIDEAAAAELEKIEDGVKAEKKSAKKAEKKAKKAAKKAAKKTSETPAEKLGSESNVVQLVNPPESDEERLASIKKATASLFEEKDSEKFTTSNGPTVDALTAVLGWTPKAAERNQAWLELELAE